jgi:hypothetical protein
VGTSGVITVRLFANASLASGQSLVAHAFAVAASVKVLHLANSLATIVSLEKETP